VAGRSPGRHRQGRAPRARLRCLAHGRAEEARFALRRWAPAARSDVAVGATESHRCLSAAVWATTAMRFAGPPLARPHRPLLRARRPM